jgi:ParB family transcriptional regulator, chromosome partitioning protein
MTTTNAAADKTSANTGAENAAPEKNAEKIHEKLAEKRRALGRGLASLLPGPRVVPVTPTLPQSARKDGAPDSSSFSSSSAESAEFGGGRAGSPVAPLNAAAESPAEPFDELQAVVSGRSPDGETVFLLETALIDDNPYQTRTDFNDDAIRELRDSIAVQGVLQPIAVRPGTEGRFILILGERRLRASKMAGKTTIPTIVKRVSKQQAAEMTLVENLQRQDLNCIDQAAAFANLSKEFNLTQEEIGKRAGISREQVSNYMRLLSLSEGIIGALQKGKLTFSHARLLLQLQDTTKRWKLAQKVMDEKLSVAKLQDLIFGVSVPADRGEPNKPSGARWTDPNVKAAQRSLEEVLGMKVRIRDRRGRGRIMIDYATLDDFDRVVGMLKGK